MRQSTKTRNTISGGLPRKLSKTPLRVATTLTPQHRKVISPKWLQKIVRLTLEYHKTVSASDPIKGREISLVLTDDATIKELNQRFRGYNEVTDVLSFSFVEPSNTEYEPIQVEPLETTAEPLEEVFGEIVISFCQATRQAKEKHCLIHNEIALLVIHGVLHLLGYDHAKVKEKKIMWQHQNASLDLVFRSN